MKYLHLTTLIAALMLSGCVTASTTMLDTQQRPATQPDDVRIYLEEDDVPRSFTKVAVIDLSGASGWTDQEQIYQKARKEAARVGANGVLLQQMEEAGTGEKLASALFGTGSDTDAQMVAIYVQPEPAQ